MLQLQAEIDGQPLARNVSDPVTGEAYLNINLQRNPGEYNLTFAVMGTSAEDLSTNVEVRVVDCGPGQVNVTGEGRPGG